MKVYSSMEFETYQVSGSELRIHWNVKQIPVKDSEDFQWEANEALCNTYDNRSQLIEKIIGSVMDTGTEIATINNKEEKAEAYTEYQAFRTQAKQLADGWLAQTKEAL